MPASALDKEHALPPFLQQSGVRQLLVHDTSTMDNPGYLGPFTYSQHLFAERALWVANPQDMVMLAKPVEDAYLAFVRNLGCGPELAPIVAPNDQCFDKDIPSSAHGLTKRLLDDHTWLEQLRPWINAGHQPLHLSTFCATDASLKLAHLLEQTFDCVLHHPGDPQTTTQANKKCFVKNKIRHIRELAMPGEVIAVKPNSTTESDKLWRVVEKYLPQTGRAIIRASFSSGGQGNIIVDKTDKENLREWLTTQTPGNFLVESYLRFNNTPNVQYWIDAHGHPQHLLTTDQRMNDATYGGNRYPARTRHHAQIDRSGLKMAQWLARRGVRGIIGLDYVETTDDNGQPHMQFVEVNARYNGSTYPTAIWFRTNHIRHQSGLAPLKYWQSFRSVPTRYPSFTQALPHIEDLLYQHNKEAGVIPYWTGAMPFGLVSCISMGSDPEQVKSLEDEFKQRLTGATV